MNKVIKIGLFLIIVGLVAFVVYSVLDERFPAFADEEFTLVEREYAKDRFTDIATDLINQQVIILPSDNENIVIKYYDSEHLYITVDEGDAVLTLTGVSERTFFGFFTGWSYLVSPEYARFYLYLPAETYALDLTTANGKISMSDYLHATTVKLESSNGDIVLADVDVAGPISLRTSNGKITLTNVEATGDLTLKTSNGKVVLTDVVAEDIDCESLNGNIEASRAEFAALDARTSNGSITITIVGAFEDFYLKMITTNGKYYLNGERTQQNAFNTSAAILVDLQTANGNIAVNFTE